jgi:hypothetical protein
VQQQAACENSLEVTTVVVAAAVEADKLGQPAFLFSFFLLSFIGRNVLIRFSVSPKHACGHGDRVRANKNAALSF